LRWLIFVQWTARRLLSTLGKDKEIQHVDLSLNGHECNDLFLNCSGSCGKGRYGNVFLPPVPHESWQNNWDDGAFSLLAGNGSIPSRKIVSTNSNDGCGALARLT
jgi:hypothetical protein